MEEEGEWTLTCTAVDYAGNAAIAVCTLNGVVGDKPIVVDTPKFPHAYISGASYVLPDLYAYDYSSGDKVGKLCDVSVEYNGQTTEYKAGESFVPTVENNNDTIKIIYSCENEKIFEKEIPVVAVFTKERIPGSTERYRDVINADRYFYTDDAVSLTNNYMLSDISGLLISSTQATNSAKVSFITSQVANAFALDFLSVPNASDFSQMNITLTDVENSDIAVTASLIKDEGQTLMVVGDTQLILTLDFDGGVATRYNVGFADGQFIVNTTTSVAVSKTNKGEAFNGFISGKVYFEIEMCNAKEGASVFLSKVCGINVSNNQDSTGPRIATEKNVEMNAFKDSIYTVQKVVATDVLCPNTVAFVTVIGPDGEVVKSVDGVLLSEVDATIDYQIKLSQYGEYYVSVIAKEADSWKYSNQSYFEYAVTVVDGEAPTITFKENFKTSLEVGDTLVIPAYTVSDNYTEADKITVLKMVINPKGMPVYLYGDTNGVHCEYAGEYKVFIYVYDQMGNLTTFETSVTVE